MGQSFERNTRVDLVVRGYWVYNVGGYYRLAITPCEGSKDEGVEYVEIAEPFVLGEAVPAPEWDDGTLLKLTGGQGQQQPYMLFTYDSEVSPEMPYTLVNTPVRYSMDELHHHYGPDIKLETVYTEGLSD